MQENSIPNLSKDGYRVLARRYRPQTFADVLGHEAVVTTLQHAICSQKTSHAYLFSGPRGTGKTTLARLFAKSLNCPSRKELSEPCNMCASCREITESRSLDVQEIDGASNRGIDNIRSITEGASYAPTSSPFKIYIVDEAHMLTKEAWNALLKTLEEPPSSVKFFFATTEPHKIPTTIISRCQRFSLRRISHAHILAKLRKISSDVGASVDDTALLRLAEYADGAMRDAESLFDQLITFSNGTITESTLEEVLGIAPFDWFLELDAAIDRADISVAYTISDRVFYEGKDIGHFLDDLTGHFKELLLTVLNIPLPTACAESRKEVLAKIARTFTQEHLIECLSLLSDAQKNIGSAASERFLLEWLLLSLIRIKKKVPLPLIVKKLFELQEKIEASPASALQEGPCQETPLVQKVKTSPPPVQREALTNVKKSEPQHIVPIATQKEKTPSPATQQEDPLLVTEVVRRSDPIVSQTSQEEASRQENLIRFAAVELGAVVSKKTK